MPTDRLCVLFGSCGSAPAEGTGVRQRLQKKAPEVGQSPDRKEHVVARFPIRQVEGD